LADARVQFCLLPNDSPDKCVGHRDLRDVIAMGLDDFVLEPGAESLDAY
jgi:hypothetical protein